ncbi:tryptophan synthase subunit alpha [Sediminibacillus dalangtanensis]|uniref:Tryptophan synthase alpha chain n=1 Tax=Sediminibacillus dalangtanensis TaxID=2729421 RepID=A0ABX7VZ78_9BACI|nr:tryptophan synthase subunit alpha [Sediminibacillus dalangtanensis]QTN00994.1 tryptophan synthase subunit alpha [Sediminibacillus dalangtanensis]
MSKQRINQAFQEVLAQGNKSFVPYIMAGDGGLDSLEEKVQFLQDSGATILELGVPFSDPVADGPTIQEAGIRALKQGVSLRAILEKLGQFKENRSIPIVLMTYLNPIYVYGVESFAEACRTAGVSGLIIPDLPLEEENLVAKELQANDIALIRLASLTSPPERLKELARRTEGFLYAVTVTGTTGARGAFHDNLQEHLASLKNICQVPVLAGFGVSTPEHVKELSANCDGVVVGSKIVDALHQNNRDEIKTLIAAASSKEQTTAE